MNTAAINEVLHAQEQARHLTAEAFAERIRQMLRNNAPHSSLRRYVARLEGARLMELHCDDPGVTFAMFGFEARGGSLRSALTAWVATVLEAEA